MKGVCGSGEGVKGGHQAGDSFQLQVGGTGTGAGAAAAAAGVKFACGNCVN